MLLKIARIAGVSVAGMALANMAWGQDVNVTTSAVSAKLGGELRAEYLHNDNKLIDDDADATGAFALSAANLKLSGKINDKTEFAMRFSLLGPTGTTGNLRSGLEYAYGTHWLNDMLGFSIGQMRVLQGGWDYANSGYRTHAIGNYTDNFAFHKYEAMLAFHAKVAGQVTVQLINDVEKQEAGQTSPSNGKVYGNYNGGSHPTFVVGWAGKFGGIEPLVNFGSYDNNKSRWIDVGVQADLAGLLATLDIHNSAVARVSGTEDVTDTMMAYTLKVAYEIKDTATPWVYYSMHDVTQDGTDAEANAAVGGWEDNGSTWGVGADLHMMGKGWSPFVAIVGESGKFLDAAGKEETRSGMTIKLGALGEI